MLFILVSLIWLSLDVYSKLSLELTENKKHENIRAMGPAGKQLTASSEASPDPMR